MKKFIYGFLQLFAENTNVTSDSGMSAEMRVHYDKTMLDYTMPKLVHDQWGEERDIPPHEGKTINFRRMKKIAKALTPLTEGQTPDGQKLQFEDLTATINEYGNHVTHSNIVATTTIDPFVVNALQNLSDNAGETLDTVSRNALQSGTNVMYAPKVSGSTETAVSARADIDTSAGLSVDLVEQSVAELESDDIPKFDGFYIGIIHPKTAYSLKRDPDWRKPHEYVDTANIYKGEVGSIGGVRFIQSSNAKVYAPAKIGGRSWLTVKTAIAASTTSVVVEEELESETLTTPIPCYINGVANTITAITKGTGDATLTVGTAITSLAKGAMVCGTGAGKDGTSVFGTLIFGRGAYAKTKLEGEGLQTFIKPVGSSGSADPLNQRGSIGWRSSKVTKILDEARIMRIEHSVAKYQFTEEN